MVTELNDAERTEYDVAVDVIERFFRVQTGVSALNDAHLLPAVREMAEELGEWLAKANVLR